MTMTHIQTIQVGAGGAASIEFTGIPATGTDLLVLLSARTSADELGASGAMRINSDSGSNYTSLKLAGGEGGVESSSNTGSYLYRLVKWDGSTYTANTFGNTQVYISNYTSSTAKSLSADSVVENNGTFAATQIGAGIWTGTAAITSLSFSASSGGSFVQYSTASLYTIQKGSGGASVS